jgi:hypothetical protein
MTDAAVAPLARAQKLAETASWLALGAMILIVLSVINEYFVNPVTAQIVAREDDALHAVLALLHAVAINSILAAPALLLVGALSDLRAALREYEAGRFFSVTSIAAVRSAGEWTLWALGMKVVGAPTLHAWVSGDPGGVRWSYESFDLGLAAIAAFVMLIGRVLEAAAAIKAENDEIV